uniref:Uncharacterized protein n=1 Tax=Meloidogyne enterolobii TaxID=390850 RepID=A0A6V7WRU2_MELEN|nr:unnamed protein product [Meloidogyne enterolobii]
MCFHVVFRSINVFPLSQTEKLQLTSTFQHCIINRKAKKRAMWIYLLTTFCILIALFKLIFDHSLIFIKGERKRSFDYFDQQQTSLATYIELEDEFNNSEKNSGKLNNKKSKEQKLTKTTNISIKKRPPKK